MTTRLKKAPPVLYPDAAVFCGPEPLILKPGKAFTAATAKRLMADYRKRWRAPPRVFIVPGQALCLGHSAGKAQGVAQVWRAHEQVVRLAQNRGRLKALSRAQVLDLIHWEAERYRQRILK